MGRICVNRCVSAISARPNLAARSRTPPRRHHPVSGDPRWWPRTPEGQSSPKQSLVARLYLKASAPASSPEHAQSSQARAPQFPRFPLPHQAHPAPQFPARSRQELPAPKHHPLAEVPDAMAGDRGPVQLPFRRLHRPDLPGAEAPSLPPRTRIDHRRPPNVQPAPVPSSLPTRKSIAALEIAARTHHVPTFEHRCQPSSRLRLTVTGGTLIGVAVIGLARISTLDSTSRMALMLVPSNGVVRSDG